MSASRDRFAEMAAAEMALLPPPELYPLTETQRNLVNTGLSAPTCAAHERLAQDAAGDTAA